MTTTSQQSATEFPPVSSHGGRPHSRQKKKKEHPDPFLEVDDEAVKQSAQPSPSDGSDGRSGTTASSAVLADLVYKPISMIALLLSLSIANWEQRKWRLSQHASHPESLWARISTVFEPEPYEDARTQAFSTTSSADSATEYHGWYRRKKHRAMAKLELNDALEMRGRVTVALYAWVLFWLCVLAYVLRRLLAWATSESR